MQAIQKPWVISSIILLPGCGGYGGIGGVIADVAVKLFIFIICQVAVHSAYKLI